MLPGTFSRLLVHTSIQTFHIKRFQITRGHVILVFVNPSTTIAGRITRLRMNSTVYEHYSIVV